MAGGILIQYEYSGDEAAWRAAVDAFVAAVQADDEVNGDFSYVVNTLGDGPKRVHIGRWTDASAVKLLQSRDYFSTFSTALQAMAGDTMTTERFATANATREV